MSMTMRRRSTLIAISLALTAAFMVHQRAAVAQDIPTTTAPVTTVPVPTKPSTVGATPPTLGPGAVGEEMQGTWMQTRRQVAESAVKGLRDLLSIRLMLSLLVLLSLMLTAITATRLWHARRQMAAWSKGP
jgi:hypothetical protein